MGKIWIMRKNERSLKSESIGLDEKIFFRLKKNLLLPILKMAN